MSDSLASLELDDAMADAPFAERHERLVAAPIEVVWSACLDVPAREVRALGPLMAVRALPRVVKERGRPGETGMGTGITLLDAFAATGFAVLRRDDVPTGGRGVVLFGAAGKFWSVAHNLPRTFDDPADFLAFAEPDHAKTIAVLEAVDQGDGTTLISTETRVVGTDRGAVRKFAPYWALIRLPSGLIRRSWLAAIDRRARRAGQARPRG